jgi:hypothetical protein
LRGHLHLAPASSSPSIAEINALVAADVLRATSVGFMGIESTPLKSGGVKYTRSELVECSLVSVPANSNALAVAKSLNISQQTRKLIFRQPGELSFGERIRQARRAIQKAKVMQARASTAKLRETYARSIALLEKHERELTRKFLTNSTASKSAQARALKDFKAQVKAVSAEVASITDDFAARVTAGAWGVEARAADTVDAFTRANERRDQHERLNTKKEVSRRSPDEGVVRWRGQVVPQGTTWQGKKT